jgi:hypothetical protein
MAATLLEACSTDEHVLVCVFFLLAKGLNAAGIHKEMFPVYGGKCLSLNAVRYRVADV